MDRVGYVQMFIVGSAKGVRELLAARLSRVAACVCLLLCCKSGHAADTPRFYSAKKSSQAPVIDGKLTEACWVKAEKTAPFVVIHGAPAEVETRGMLCWDDANLYVGLICDEPLSAKLKKLIEAGAIGRFEESIEVFIDANFDRHTYLQLMLSVVGEKYTARGASRDPSLDSEWSARTSINDGSWTVELQLPLKVIGVSEPSVSTLWGLNLNRTRTVGGRTVYTCWSDTKGGFHTPARFGRLIFFGYDEWLRANIRRRLGGLETEIGDVLSRYRVALPRLTDRLDALASRRRELISSLSTAHVETAHAFAPVYQDGESLVAEGRELLGDARLEVIRNQFGEESVSALPPELEALRRTMGQLRVRIEHKLADRTEKGKPTFREESWRFDTGLRCPTLKYSRFLNIPPHFVGVHRSLVNGDMGIGLDGGAYGNWYRGNCIRVLIDDVDIFAARAADTIEAKEGEDAHLRFVWQLGDGRSVALNITVPSNGMAVYSRIDLNLKGKSVERVQAALQCYPGGYGPYYGLPSRRWVATSGYEADVPKDFRPSEEAPFPTLTLRPGQAWVFYADKLRHGGSLGLVFLPEEGTAGVVKLSNYGQRTLLSYPPDTKRIHLGFYAFDVENVAAKALFVDSIPAELERLRTIQFWPD